MATLEGSSKNHLAMRLGKSGLFNVAKINIAASHALSNIQKSVEAIKMFCDGSSFHLRLSFETAEKDCAGITNAYKGFSNTEDDVATVLRLSEMIYHHQRALVTVESLSSRIGEKHMQFGRMEYKAPAEVRERWVEIVKLLKGSVEARESLQKMLNDDDVVKKESED